MRSYRDNGGVGGGGGGGFGARSKTVYDDVFGGPPKFGAMTLPPRLEDYTEIFQGFHASRGSSIPVLVWWCSGRGPVVVAVGRWLGFGCVGVGARVLVAGVGSSADGWCRRRWGDCGEMRWWWVVVDLEVLAQGVLVALVKIRVALAVGMALGTLVQIVQVGLVKAVRVVDLGQMVRVVEVAGAGGGG